MSSRTSVASRSQVAQDALNFRVPLGRGCNSVCGDSTAAAQHSGHQGATAVGELDTVCVTDLRNIEAKKSVF